jgi:hypothetical protein
MPSLFDGPLDEAREHYRRYGIAGFVPPEFKTAFQRMPEQARAATDMIGPAADVQDMKNYSAATMDSLRAGNYSGSLANALMTGAALGMTALPGSVGGIDKAVKKLGVDDLPMDTASRMKRAEEMGFGADAYHGTNVDVTEFDDAFKGRATKARSAKKAHWFTDDAPTAAGYGDFAKDREVTDLLDEARRHERGNRWDKVHELEVQAEKLDQGPQERGQNVIPIKLRGNLFEFDADGARYNDISAQIEEVLDKAKADGLDGVKFKNLVDQADYSLHNPATHYAIFDPKNIRSRFAKFDPAKKDSANLLASVGGAGLLGTLAMDNE